MYQTPKLFQLGKVENLTLGFGDSFFDGNPWSYRIRMF